MNAKSTLWQGSLLGVIALIILAGMNMKLIRSLFQTTNNPDDFQYHDSAFVVYNGPFQDSPWLAVALWIAIIFVASIIALTVVKMFWFALRKRGLPSNR